jgi:hypothetical protein
MDALTRYQIGKAGQFVGPLALSKSAALTAISNARLSGAIKPKGEKRGESPEKNQDKPKIDTLEKVKQEFIKYVQEHPQPQTTTGKQTAADNNSNRKVTANKNDTTTTVNNSMTVVYDIAANELEKVKNAPSEKKKAMNRFLDFLKDKDNRVIIGHIIAQTIAVTISEFVRKHLSSN